MTKEIHRFLLGQMNEGERLAFEERQLIEDDLADLVAAEERDLLDAHVRGELSTDDATALEEGLLATPAGHQGLEVAQALYQLEDTRRRGPLSSEASAPRHHQPAARRPMRRWIGVAAAALLLLVAGRWWLDREDAPGETVVVRLSSFQPMSSAQPTIIELSKACRHLELVVDVEAHADLGPFGVELYGPGEKLLLELTGVEPVDEQGYPVLRFAHQAETPLGPGTYRLELLPADSAMPLRQTFRLVR